MKTPYRALAGASAVILVLLATASAGCQGDSSPPTPSPISLERPDTTEVSLASVQALVPLEVGAYSAWQVQRRGGLAVAVIVENFVRDICFERQLYSRESEGGAFVRDGPMRKGSRGIGQTTEQRAPPLLLNQALDKDRLPYGDRIHVTKHGLHRPALSIARVEAPEGGHPLELTTEFTYDLAACTLPPRIGPSQVPTPRGSTLPTQEVISRDRAVFGKARLDQAYVNEMN